MRNCEQQSKVSSYRVEGGVKRGFAMLTLCYYSAKWTVFSMDLATLKYTTPDNTMQYPLPISLANPLAASWPSALFVNMNITACHQTITNVLHDLHIAPPTNALWLYGFESILVCYTIQGVHSGETTNGYTFQLPHTYLYKHCRWKIDSHHYILYEFYQNFN